MSLAPAMKLLMFNASRFQLSLTTSKVSAPFSKITFLEDFFSSLLQSTFGLIYSTSTASGWVYLISQANQPIVLVFVKLFISPIAPQTARLPILLSVLCRSNEYPILPSIPNEKQLQKCLLKVLASITLLQPFSTFSNLPYSWTSASTIQISRFQAWALSQQVTLFLNLEQLQLSKSGLFSPQPNTLAKSFPVPRGIIVMGTLEWSIWNLDIQVTTHITVPSPPHMTSITGALVLTLLASCWKPQFLCSQSRMLQRLILMATKWFLSSGRCDRGTLKLSCLDQNQTDGYIGFKQFFAHTSP